MIKYLQLHPQLPLIIGSGGKGNLYWLADAAFAVLNDIQGHTCIHMPLGQGTVVGISTKQKMNTESSTEVDLVGINELLPKILWARLFALAQNTITVDSILYQDNISAIQMEQN